MLESRTVSTPRLSETQAFGLAVRSRRSRRALSQEALAELAGLHRTYIGSVERGERNVTLKNITAIAAALGMVASQLLAEAERLRGKPTD